MPDSAPSKSTENPARKTYHHGNLVEALIAAAIALIEEKGVENLSVREVAKKAGVSPGAPFRHFANKTALLTAVAEQAMSRLAHSVEAALSQVRSGNPMDELRAFGLGYLRWARENPTHFQIISSRSLIDFPASGTLVAENERLRQKTAALVQRAQAQGAIRASVDAEDVMLSARAFVYGLSRMYIDGHFPEWRVSRAPDEAMRRALDLFVEGLASHRP
ncbi:TetR/AcrR family transcriptional regulator [Rhizobium puerariae]|uniref:TetR/AcrR family transcriptional regulator n=1 Tax=Rhizobium puerariae TaxID=1585791 RepID=A0ABV6AGS0_9HYPH